MFLYIIENTNPNYSIIPCFVEKDPRTTFKICVISKQSLWFFTASTYSSSYSSLKKNSLSHLLLFPFLFQNSPPFWTIRGHIIMVQNNKNSKFKLTKFPDLVPILTALFISNHILNYPFNIIVQMVSNRPTIKIDAYRTLNSNLFHKCKGTIRNTR